MTEEVDSGGGSPSIRVVDQTGKDQSVSGVGVDPANAYHITAKVSGLLTGTYTVLWSNRSKTDGHTISGSFSFRVASSTRAPGAATVEGDTPAAWAVATRWITFLGAALVAGIFAFALAVSRTHLNRPLRRLAIAGAALALAATAAEPFLSHWFPPTGAQALSISEAIRALPDAWWCRPAGLAIALAAAIAAPRLSLARPVAVLAGLGALLGLSLTSHAAGRANWKEAAVASNIVHQTAVALWVAGLIALAVYWRTKDGNGEIGPVARRFSRFALVLAPVAIATGIVNAGFVFPSLDELWSSRYGDTLLIKIAVLLPVLGFATFHFLRVRRKISDEPAGIARTVRWEAIAAVLVLLGGSLLALTAPPSKDATAQLAGENTTGIVDLRQPILAEKPGDETWVHLQLKPAKAGANDVTIALKTGDGSVAPIDPPVKVEVRFVSLEQPIVTDAVEAAPSGEKTFAAPGNQLNLDGLWRAEVRLRWLGREDVVLPYYLLFPDPNIYGMDAPAGRESDPAAADYYEKAMTAYTGIHTADYDQLMADGKGGGVVSKHILNDGADASNSGYYYKNLVVNGWEAIVFADKMWTRYPGELWEESDGQAMIPPAEWGNEYEGATGFRFGIIDEIDGERYQVLTFVVPAGPGRVIAWYAWWVNVETGQVRRDIMVSRSHYMISDFLEIDGPVSLAPPAPDQIASPVPE
jgi:copper transport protein